MIQNVLLGIALIEVALHALTELSFLVNRGRVTMSNLDIFLVNIQFVAWILISVLLLKI